MILGRFFFVDHAHIFIVPILYSTIVLYDYQVFSVVIVYHVLPTNPRLDLKGFFC